jgi:hypothetical protein
MSFKMKIDLSQVSVSTKPRKTDLDTGVYQCIIKSLQGRNMDSEGFPTRGMFILEILDPEEYEGISCVTSMSVAKHHSDPVCRYWKLALISCGYDEDEINEITEYSDENFVGKECYIEYKSKQDNGGRYDKVDFLSYDSYLYKKEEIAERKKINKEIAKKNEERAKKNEDKAERKVAQSSTENNTPKIKKVAPPPITSKPKPSNDVQDLGLGLDNPNIPF